MLEELEETGDVGTIHQGVMELHGDGQGGAEPVTTVAAPGEEGIGIDARVLIDHIFQLGFDHCRSANDIGFTVDDVLAGFGGLLRDAVVVAAELLQVVGVGDVAVADATLGLVHNDVDGQPVEAVQPVLVYQQVELVNLAGSTADAPTEQHVELQSFASANLAQTTDVEDLTEC